MRIFRKSTSGRLPIRLVDTTGAPVTGKISTDFLAGKVSVIKEDGTVADITLSDSGGGQNLFEIHTTKAPGLYHVLVPSTATDQVGGLQLAYMPAASAFVGSIATATVEDFAAIIWNAARASYQTGSSFGALMRLMTQVFAGHVKIDSGTFVETVYQEDGTTPFVTRQLKDASGTPASLTATEAEAGTAP